MQDCSISGLGLFWCDSASGGDDTEEQRGALSQSAATPRGENISCVAGLQNMLPGLEIQISDDEPLC